MYWQIVVSTSQILHVYICVRKLHGNIVEIMQINIVYVSLEKVENMGAWYGFGKQFSVSQDIRIRKIHGKCLLGHF